MDLAELQIKADTRGLRDANKELDNLAKKGDRAETSTTNMNKAFKIGAGLIASYFSIQTVRRIVSMANETANLADQIDKMNERTGIGVQRLQELRFVTDQTGVSFGAIESAVESFTRRIPRIETGSGRAADVMGQLGVSLRDSTGDMRDMGDLIPEIIASLSEMENRTERNALAQELLGRNSSELIPMLNAGGEEIDRLIKRYQDMGVAMDESAIRKGVEYKDRMAEMSTQTEGLRNEVGFLAIELLESLIPAMEGMVNIGGVVIRSEFFSGFLQHWSNEVKLASFGIDGLTGSLRNQIEMSSSTADAIRKQIEYLREARGEMLQNGESVIDVTNIILDLEKSLRNASIVQEQNNRVTEEAATANEALSRSVERVRVAYEKPIPSIFDPMEEDRIRRIRKEFDDFTNVFSEIGGEDFDFSHRMFPPGSIGAINEEISQLQRKMQSAFDPDEVAKYQAKINELKNDLNDLHGSMDEISQSGRMMGDAVGFALEDMIMGAMSASEALQNLLDDILRIAIRQSITQPLGESLGTAFAGFFANGGRMRPGEWGIAGEAGPEIIAADGAGVNITPITPRTYNRGSAGSNVAVNVNVTNQSNSEVEVQERPNAQGGVDLEVMVRRAVQGAHNSGQMDRIMSRNYGVQRKGMNRG